MKAEGELDSAALAVLEEELVRYRSLGLAEVRLLCDGLTAVTHRIRGASWPADLGIVFATRRQPLFRVLQSYGLQAELDPSP